MRITERKEREVVRRMDRNEGELVRRERGSEEVDGEG